MINSEDEPMFYSWQCFSLIFQGRTRDFVVKDYTNIMRVLLCLEVLIKYNQINKLEASLS